MLYDETRAEISFQCSRAMVSKGKALGPALVQQLNHLQQVKSGLMPIHQGLSHAHVLPSQHDLVGCFRVLPFSRVTHPLNLLTKCVKNGSDTVYMAFSPAGHDD